MKYELPTLIFQEENVVKNHSKELISLGTKAFIITGKHSSKKNGSLDTVIEVLKQNNIAYVIFDEIEENPSVETCVKAASLGLEEHVDFIIGIGGGSPLDASKAISLLISNHTLESDIFYKPENKKYTTLPIASIPTTAGTGSEATPYAILTLHDQHTKKSISHRIFPTLSLCDPTYLSSVPFQTLKNTAVDTLAHLIESYLNTNATDYSRMMCEYGLSLWGKCREDLLGFSMDTKEYQMMMTASTIGGMTISHTGTSLPHGLSYLVTYEQQVAHGAACGLFLPGYLYFCMKHEAMGTTPASHYMTNKDVEKIFSLLGLKDLQEFALMLYSLLGNIPVAENLWQENIKKLFENPGKIKNCPYPLTKEELEQFI